MHEGLQKEMEVLLLHETEQMKRKFTHHLHNPLPVVKSLSGRDPVQILVDVYETCINYFSQTQRRK